MMPNATSSMWRWALFLRRLLLGSLHLPMSILSYLLSTAYQLVEEAGHAALTRFLNLVYDITLYIFSGTVDDLASSLAEFSHTTTTFTPHNFRSFATGTWITKASYNRL